MTLGMHHAADTGSRGPPAGTHDHDDAAARRHGRSGAAGEMHLTLGTCTRRALLTGQTSQRCRLCLLLRPLRHCPTHWFLMPAPTPLLRLFAVQLLDEKERQFLHTALLNYTRCLASGDAYDLRVVFRIVQLWLRWAAVGMLQWYRSGKGWACDIHTLRGGAGRRRYERGAPRPSSSGIGSRIGSSGGIGGGGGGSCRLATDHPCSHPLPHAPRTPQAGPGPRGEPPGGCRLPQRALTQVPAAGLPSGVAHVGRWGRGTAALPLVVLASAVCVAPAGGGEPSPAPAAHRCCPRPCLGTPPLPPSLPLPPPRPPTPPLPVPAAQSLPTCNFPALQPSPTSRPTLWRYWSAWGPSIRTTRSTRCRRAGPGAAGGGGGGGRGSLGGTDEKTSEAGTLSLYH